MAGPATLPPLFWYLFYYFLIATFISSLIVIFSSNFKILSLISLVFVITIPFVAFLKSLGIHHPHHPLYNLNEIELLLYGLKQGDFGAFYVVSGLLFILTWWFLFLINIRNSKIKLTLRLVTISSLLVGIGIYFGAIAFNLSNLDQLLLTITGGTLYFLIFYIKLIHFRTH